MKIYCQQCRYIGQYSYATMGIPKPGEPQHMYCSHNKNIICESFNTWFQNVKNVEYEKRPSEINKNNNCAWFEKFDTTQLGACIGVETLKNL